MPTRSGCFVREAVPTSELVRSRTSAISQDCGRRWPSLSTSGVRTSICTSCTRRCSSCQPIGPTSSRVCSRALVRLVSSRARPSTKSSNGLTAWLRLPSQYSKNATLVRERLRVTHGLPLTQADIEWIERVLRAFYADGPKIDYYGSRAVDAVRPSYRQLMTATDRFRRSRSFLATEDRFRFVKDLQSRNLIVPVVGDFAGPSAIRRVGDYLRAHGGTHPGVLRFECRCVPDEPADVCVLCQSCDPARDVSYLVHRQRRHADAGGPAESLLCGKVSGTSPPGAQARSGRRHVQIRAPMTRLCN